MRTRGLSLLVCMWCGLVAMAATADNPYEKIVVRNLFGLKDPPPPPPPGSDKPAPPPITLQGFTTILGKNQVLFKVSMPAKPPQPAAEVSKILAEGERDGDITVLEISMADRSAKFDNFGTVEVKNMKDHAAKPSGAPVMVAGTVPTPGITPMPQPNFNVGGSSASPPVVGSGYVSPNAQPQPASSGLSARASGLQSSLTARERRSSTTAAAVVDNHPTPRTVGQNWPPEQPMSAEEQEIRIAIDQKMNEHNPDYPGVPGTALPNKGSQSAPRKQ